MPSLKWSLVAAAAIATSPAFAMYKCKDANGRTAFQERPCESTGTQGSQIEVKPAAGPAEGAGTNNSRTAHDSLLVCLLARCAQSCSL